MPCRTAVCGSVDTPAYPSLKTCPQSFEQIITEMEIEMRICTSYCTRRPSHPCTRVQVRTYGWVDVCKYDSRHIAPLLCKEGHIPKGGSVFLYRNACLSGDSFPHRLVSISAFSRKQAKACMRLSTHICRTIKQKMK